MKTKINKTNLRWLLLFITLAIYLWGYTATTEAITNIFQPFYLKTRETPKFQEIQPIYEDDDEAYVMKEVRKAGLNENEAWAIIQQESGWREDICVIEPDDTISCGLWMLNTVHNKNGLTNACKVDYKCSTEFAINKRLNDGDWCAWTAAKILGLCK